MEASTSRPINRFLLDHRILIRDNPAISPDLTLDCPRLIREIAAETDLLACLPNGRAAAAAARRLVLYPASEFPLGRGRAFVVESPETGDAALLVHGEPELGFADPRPLGKVHVVGLTWENLVLLKNRLLEEDPGSTIFPKADGTLAKASLGIGARFTTLHWPAVAWAMKHLGLSLTANQNSIPRELVFDVDAMLGGKLADVPFPFVGGSVPEGHQGQSVQGMSHAAIVTYLKLGFHRHRIPWGFNADHQPIGGRFDAIETQLVEGSLFASYITYDLSPELSLSHRSDYPPAGTSNPPELSSSRPISNGLAPTVDPKVHRAVVERLTGLGLSVGEEELESLLTYLWPAMHKMVRRDALYTRIRAERFTSPEGRAFFKELSIDELPGQTTPETLAVCLAIGEAMGVTFNYVAPNIGFQKNFPYADNAELARKVSRLFEVSSKFGVSFGFHSGSGKSAENYRVCGEVTRRCLEIKTSGRYTYEMGAALARSPDPGDQQLWRDWYAFTRQLATEGAFSDQETRRKFAREFITRSLETAGQSADGVFASPDQLAQALASLSPSPDHMFWFEYNFLFVLAAGGSTSRLGDHTPDGYRQRARFYGISDQGKLLFVQNVARYIAYLAETTGICPPDRVEAARESLEGYRSYPEFIADIA
jgi:hypothetical protein